MNKENKFNVIKGSFTQGDPDVIQSFKNAYEFMINKFGDNLCSFVIICTQGSEKVSHYYNSGETPHMLIGGLNVVKSRLIDEIKDELDTYNEY